MRHRRQQRRATRKPPSGPRPGLERRRRTARPARACRRRPWPPPAPRAARRRRRRRSRARARRRRSGWRPSRARAGVLERVRQRLLDDPVGGELEPDGNAPARPRPTAPPAARLAHLRRRARPSRRARAAEPAGRLRRCAASREPAHLGRAPATRSARPSREPRASTRLLVREDAPLAHRPARPSSRRCGRWHRAVRARCGQRSAMTASRAARSRSRSAIRACGRGRRRTLCTRSITTVETTMNVTLSLGFGCRTARPRAPTRCTPRGRARIAGPATRRRARTCRTSTPPRS